MNDAIGSDASLRVPERLAKDMIQRLFRHDEPNSANSILYPGIGYGELARAVEQYCERRGFGVPSGVAVETNQQLVEEARKNFPTLEILHTDFLSELPDIGLFDYIVSNPPVGRLRSTSTEVPEDYAIRFDTVSTSNSQQDGDVYLAFMEQSLRLLEPEGRLVFITPDYTNQERSKAIPNIKEKLSMFQIEDIDEILVDSVFNDIEQGVVLTVVSHVEPTGDFATNVDFNRVQSSLTAEYRIGVSDIATLDPVTFYQNDTVRDVQIDLVRNDFDAAPVRNSEAGACIGLVSRANLTTADSGRIEEGHIEELNDERLVDPLAPFNDVVDRLARVRFCLVGDEHDVRGIITRFDLNHMEVFFHLYAKFAQLEIGFRNAIRDYNVDWENALIEGGRSSSDISKLSRRHHDKTALSQDIFDTLLLSDLVKIIVNSHIHGEIGLRDIVSETEFSELILVRNAVAHYQPIVHTLDTIEFSGRRTAGDFAEVYTNLNNCLEMLRSHRYVAA